ALGHALFERECVTAQLIVKLRVFEGDGRLIRKDLQTFCVQAVEEAWRLAVQVQKTDNLTAHADRRAAMRAHPGQFGEIDPTGIEGGDWKPQRFEKSLTFGRVVVPVGET